MEQTMIEAFDRLITRLGLLDDYLGGAYDFAVSDGIDTIQLKEMMGKVKRNPGIVYDLEVLDTGIYLIVNGDVTYPPVYKVVMKKKVC